MKLQYLYIRAEREKLLLSFENYYAMGKPSLTGETKQNDSTNNHSVVL